MEVVYLNTETNIFSVVIFSQNGETGLDWHVTELDDNKERGQWDKVRLWMMMMIIDTFSKLLFFSALL